MPGGSTTSPRLPDCLLTGFPKCLCTTVISMFVMATRYTPSLSIHSVFMANNLLFHLTSSMSVLHFILQLCLINFKCLHFLTILKIRESHQDFTDYLKNGNIPRVKKHKTVLQWSKQPTDMKVKVENRLTL